MKKIIFLFWALSSLINLSVNAGTKVLVRPVHEKKISLFSLKDIRLLDSDFKHIQDLNHEYLLSLDPDRLVSWFRREAGLTPKALPYPFWESDRVGNHGPLAGHIMGFYLSAMSMMYDSTDDPKILERLKYTLGELDLCQRAGGDGYLLATINGRHVFEDVVDGNFKTSNPFINDCWEPVYIMNKIMLGLHGVYTRCDLPLAKDILVKMADWFGYSVLDKLSHEDIQKLLVCEHGSINESYIDVYTVTGDKKYLNWACVLNDEDMWIPMSEGRDILEGWHANTQIPKFTGFESVYRYTGDDKYTRAARFFWETVVSKHTWVMGGNSTGEHFFPANEFERRVELNGGPESCNSVNMLRLTESLYQDYAESDKVDYYEKVLFNHILSNYDPEQGMCVYYTSMRPGHYRVYGTKFDSFWCCTGTGFEQTAKLGQMIYAHDMNGLYVNLFIPSVVRWRDGISLKQETLFPDENLTQFTIYSDKDERFTLNLRHPNWITSSRLTIRINGKKIKLATNNSRYVEIDRVWRNGDKVELELPAAITMNPLNKDGKYVAIKYGPIVLASKVEDENLQKEDFRFARLTVAIKDFPMIKAPSLIGNVDKMPLSIVRKKGQPLTFICQDKVASTPFELVPFSRIHWSRYAIYFRHYQNRQDFLVEFSKQRKEEQEQELLNRKTVDQVIITDPVSEKAHKMECVNSSTGYGWRHAENGGYFMYNMKVKPDCKQSLSLKFLGSDSGARVFDVLIDGQNIATIDHCRPNPEHSGLYVQLIEIPTQYLSGKDNVTVKFQARNRNTAGGLFDLRIVSHD